MSIDISLIPQERIKDLVSTLDNIQNSLSNNIVHKTGNETITGTKTFTGKIVGDNSIEWGGTNLLSNVSPTDAGCLDDFGHNKAAYWGGLIDAEYTVDGKTWIDYGLSSYQKWALTTANGTDVIVGKNTKKASDGTLTNDNIANVRARITLHIKDANDRSRFYSALRKIVLNVSTNGASKCKVKVLTRTLENYTSGTDTWVDRGTYEVRGYSGWNSIPFINNLGGYDNQKGYNADLRLEFWSENIATTSRTSCLSIKDIRLIGVTNWIADDFAKTGHLYSISDSKIATFPNTINFSTPEASDNSTKGATTEWVNSPELSTNIVHKAGNETIAGTKTFTGFNPIVLQNNSGKNTTLTLKDSTTSYGTSAVDFVQATSNNFNQLLIHFQEGNKWCTSWEQDPTSKNIKIYFTGSEAVFAPTPATSDNNTKIATTNWSKIVHPTYPNITTSTRVSVPANTDYSIPYDCWVWWGNTSYVGVRYLYVNGIEFGHSYGNSGRWEEFNTLFFPIKAGNVIRHTGDNSTCFLYQNVY